MMHEEKLGPNYNKSQVLACEVLSLSLAVLVCLYERERERENESFSLFCRCTHTNFFSLFNSSLEFGAPERT